jgi:hypothetical protein
MRDYNAGIIVWDEVKLVYLILAKIRSLRIVKIHMLFGFGYPHFFAAFLAANGRFRRRSLCWNDLVNNVSRMKEDEWRTGLETVLLVDAFSCSLSLIMRLCNFPASCCDRFEFKSARPHGQR